MRKILVIAALSLVFIFPGDAFARRSNVPNWYIEDFKAEIVVNKDSSLTITEDILADCGNVPNKHGIFRILPTVINTTAGEIKTPIKLISITDASGKAYNYAESYDYGDKTIIWKIGDADITVRGENLYRIKYTVQNAIRTENSKKLDEFYWNLNGNFWDLETDSFTAKIIFPSEVNRDNTSISYYSGTTGDKGMSLANFQWVGDNTLEFKTTRTMRAREGVTASIMFPKGIVVPYKAGLIDFAMIRYLWLLIPVLVFSVCFRIWRRYGDDPDFNKTIIAEYAPPADLTPLEIGVLGTNGAMEQRFITASIIRMAVMGFITIKEVTIDGILIDSKDYEVAKTSLALDGKLSSAEHKIYSKLFEGGETVRLKNLKDKFYKINKEVAESVLDSLEKKGLIEKRGVKMRGAMISIGFVAIVLGAQIFEMMPWLTVSSVLSGFIIIGFGAAMAKRTYGGAETDWKIKGFKLYMDTAEKYRQEFYEKENIFEKYLPYAIIFGITGQWIAKMKDIYGAEYFNSYHPAWYGGNMGSNSFDADSFSKSITNLSSAIAANTSSPSGQGGSGHSGGGGGGGGGGGW